MRYFRSLAAPLLALSLLQPAQAQTPSQPAKQTAKQAYQAPQRDEEFLRLYDDVKWFEDSRRENHEKLGSFSGPVAARIFKDSISRLAKRYVSDIRELASLYTCGKYLQVDSDNDLYKRLIFGDFFVVAHNGGVDYDDSILKKITRNRGNRLGINVVDLDMPEDTNMQRISKTSFADLREAISLYNRQIKEENDRQWTTEGHQCAQAQIIRIRNELLEAAEIRDDSGTIDISAPKGSSNIVLYGVGEFKPGLPFVLSKYVYTVSISPDGTADLWFKDSDDYLSKLAASSSNAPFFSQEEAKVKKKIEFGKK